MASPAVTLCDIPAAMAQDMVRYAALHEIQAVVDEPVSSAIWVMPADALAQRAPMMQEASGLVLLGAGDVPDTDMPWQVVSVPVSLAAWLAAVRQVASAKAGREMPLGNGWQLRLSMRELTDGTQQIALTDKETELLKLLGQHSEPISKEQLLESVWGYDSEVDTHTLETHIYRLRGKLAQMGEGGVELLTTPDGYSLFHT